MIGVCPELETRLDKAWSKLQRTIHEREGKISQIDLDTKTVEAIEGFAIWTAGESQEANVQRKLRIGDVVAVSQAAIKRSNHEYNNRIIKSNGPITAICREFITVELACEGQEEDTGSIVYKKIDFDPRSVKLS